MRPGLPELPERMRALPIDERGYPVPRFVEWIDGKPDFRVASASFLRLAVHRDLCWICGQQLGRFRSYLIGPMCAVNRVSSEPPSHRECAVFAAQACPFLTMPKMRRREGGLPEKHNEPAGFMIARNPGVALVWVTREKTRPFRAYAGGEGVLFEVTLPAVEVLWFAEGRAATRAEVLEAIESGLPALQEVAKKQGGGASEQLTKDLADALALVPA